MHELASVQDFIRWGASRLQEAGVSLGHGTDNAVDEAWYLVLYALYLAPEIPEALLPARLTMTERQAVVNLLERRATERLPAAYLTNEAWFAGLRFYVDSRVLVPCSPLAELIEQGCSPWLEPHQVRRVLDLGTGSGCIAVACAYAFPEARVDAADVSAEALKVADINIARHELAERVRTVRSDLFAELGDRHYDLIISNPPYVSSAEMMNLPAEYRHEPAVGLAAGDEGLAAVARILLEAADHLDEQGVLVVEVGNTEAAVRARFPELPCVWLEFERGGHGAFLVSRQDLLSHEEALAAAAHAVLGGANPV